MIIKRLFKERGGEDVSRAENKYSVPVTPGRHLCNHIISDMKLFDIYGQ